jgi:hypothetical protein
VHAFLSFTPKRSICLICIHVAATAPQQNDRKFTQLWTKQAANATAPTTATNKLP